VAALVATLPATGIVAAQPDPTPPVELRETLLAEGLARAGFARQVDARLAADAVGFSWEGAAGGAVEFRVRQGEGWTTWMRVEGDPAEGPDHDSPEYTGRTTAGPVWLGSGPRQVEVRVAEGSLRGLRLHALRADRGDPGRFAARPAGADPAWPDVIFRWQWGADETWRPKTQECRSGNPLYAPTVRYAILHHTDTANDYAPGDVPAILRAIYKFHVTTNGWCDLGYNLFVDRFGRAWEGRFGGVDRAVVGAHAAGFNTGSTGVALLGRFHDDVVPQAMYTGARRLLTWKLFRHGVDPRATMTVVAGANGDARHPAGTPVQVSGITGHRDVANTVCPGNLGQALLPTLRSEVQRDIMNTVPYPIEGRVPAPTGPAVLTLDAHGGLHPAGAQAAVTHGGYWADGFVARAAVRYGAGGYVLDWWGALHPFGGAPPVAVGGYWVGWDIARDVAPAHTPDRPAGWVLSGWGSLHPFGGAPDVVDGPWWPEWDIARSVVARPGGQGGYVLSGWGSVHPFGGAPPVSISGYWEGWDIARAIALRPDGVSGWVLSGWGSLHPFGGAPAVAGTYWSQGRDTARDLVLTGDGNGGWVVDADGRLWPFGSAPPLPPRLTWTGTDLGRAAL
jgi:hypothetical protein